MISIGIIRVNSQIPVKKIKGQNKAIFENATHSGLSQENPSK
jgi:hypothetical protein